MSNEPRNKAEALLGVDFRIRLHERHCRLYKRMRGGLMVVSLAAGSAAITTLIQTTPGALAFLAAIIAVLAYIEGAMNLAALAERHSLWTKQFTRMRAGAETMDVEAIDASKTELIADTTVDVKSLCNVAYNDALKSAGYEDGMRPESRMERFMRAIA